MLKVFIISLLTCAFSLIPGIFWQNLPAQNEMRVERCTSVDQRTPIYNVFVDLENNKWVGSEDGLFLVKACDLAEPVKLNEDEISMLSFPDGNMDIRCKITDLAEHLKSENLREVVSSAYYQEKTQELWIGTYSNGLYQFRINDGVNLVQRFHTGNSKIRSDQINSIHIDKSGRIWAGTYDGVFVRIGNKWEVMEKYLNFQAITSNSTYTWLLADNFLWTVDARNRWTSVDIGDEMVEGIIQDISFDQAGNLWIASEALTRYTPSTGDYKVFDGADYYTSSYANCLATDQDGAVWVGTDDKGLYIIEKASAMTVNCIIEKGLSCDGSRDDAILSVKINGGQPPYEYRWEDNVRDSRREGMAAGEYLITVTDAKGKSKSAKAIIGDPQMRLELALIRNADPDSGENGSAQISVSGGIPDYLYQWDNGETGEKALNLKSGLHQVTVTDQNGCTATSEINIPQSVAPLVIKLQPLNQNVCAGEKNNTLEVEIKGGEPPFAVTWNDPTYTGTRLTALIAGTYAVTVSDEAGNTENTSIELEDPEEINLSVVIIKSANTNQADGQARIIATGGDRSYTYQWDNGETIASATKLGAGIHQVTVTDGAGCFKTGQVEMSEDIIPLQIQLTQTAENKCFGDRNAAIQVDIIGGKNPFQTSWNKNWDRPQGNGAIVHELSAGTYAVTVTDAIGNESSAEITIPEVPAMTTQIKTIQPASVNGSDGIATVTVQGGSGNYQYIWSNSEKAPTASSLSAATHYITITDQFGCQVLDSVQITENILPLTAQIIQTKEILCYGDSTAVLEVNLQGGKPPFQFNWNIPNVTAQRLDNLPAGTYTVTIVDGVKNQTSATVEVIAPEKIEGNTAIIKAASVGESDGSAEIHLTGGTGNYTYLWDNGETKPIAEKLNASPHSVTITDEAGCTWVDQITMTENILPLAVQIQQTQQINCYGEAGATLNVKTEGGKGPFRYSWNIPGQDGDQVSNLPAGEYLVTVTDAVGSAVSGTYLVPQPEELFAQSNQINPATANNEDGKAMIEASGGTAPYSYHWENGNTSETADQLRPGSHRITITDAAGCTTHSMVIIKEDIQDLHVSLSVDHDLLCAGDQNGALTVEIKGGKAPYTYNWNNPDLQGGQIKDLGNGHFAVTVTDASQQSNYAEINLTHPKPIIVEVVDQRSATDENTPDGSVQCKTSGGTGELSFLWDNGVQTAENKALTAGLHILNITDQNGCEEKLEVEIKKRYLPELVMSRLQDGQIIEMQQVQFNADSARLNEESIPILDELTNFLLDNPSIIIQVQGHTNNVPPHEFCDALSSSRAETVANYLINKGIANNRVFFKGFGKRNPKYTNLTEEGRRKNQRVEIMIRKTS